MNSRLLDALDAAVESRRDLFVRTVRHLYDHPELSGEEHNSARLLASLAQDEGFQVTHGVAKLPTAFAAKRQFAPGPEVAFLAEYDALPAVGHGCGHNLIGTVSTVAALALADVARQHQDFRLCGTVALYGTPAEETDGGKITMLDAGVFDSTAAALMAHPGNYDEFAYTSLACRSVRVTFHGRAAHAAAAPWQGINALDAVLALFANVASALKALPSSARMPGIIVHGGQRANMIPHLAVAEFSLRERTRDDLRVVYEKFVSCARAAAESVGAQYELEDMGNAYDDMRPDSDLEQHYANAWAYFGGQTPAPVERGHGSLDIGNLSHRFPCLHPAYRITTSEVSGHTCEFADATLTPLATEQGLRTAKSLAATGAAVLLAKSKLATADS